MVLLLPDACAELAKVIENDFPMHKLYSLFCQKVCLHRVYIGYCFHTASIHSCNSHPEPLSSDTCQGNVISEQQNLHQHLLCGILAMHELAIYHVANGDVKPLQLWQ